jgi:hypothetical protein
MATTDAALFAYIQARIQARHGDRPDEELWRRLDTSRDAGRYLQLARDSGLRDWVRHFAAHDDPAQWERSLRADWARTLAQLTGWPPREWRAAMLWLRLLPALPAIALILRGTPPPAWVHDDPFFAALDPSDPQAFRASLERSPWQALLEHWDDERPWQSWLASWRALWPAGDERVTAQLEISCGRTAAAWDPAAPDHKHWHAILEREFTRLLRRHPRTMLALFGYIGLVSLDMLHLRAGLIRLHIAQQAPEAAA